MSTSDHPVSSHFDAVASAVSGDTLSVEVLQHLPVGVMLFRALRDASGQITDFSFGYANAAAEQIIGSSWEQLQGRRMLDVLPGNRDTGLFERYVRVVETGEDDRNEFKYQADGIDNWFSNWSSKLGDGFVVAFVNVTGQRLDRIRTTRAASLVQAMYDESPFAKALVEAETGEILFTNQTFRDLVSKDAGRELIAREKDAFSLAGKAILEVIDQVRRTGLSYSVDEKPLIMENGGETRFFRLDVRYLSEARLKVRSPLKQIQISAFDVTDFVSSRLRAEQLAWRLAEEEEQYRATFTAAPVGIAHLDEFGMFCSGNEHLLAMLGVSEAELKMHSLRELCDHPEDRGSEIEALLAARKTFRQLELRLRRRNGSHLWASLTLSSLRGRDGRVRNFVLVVEDISRRVEARQRLMESMQHKDEFLAVLGHELRNPLAALRSATALLATHPAEPEKMARIQDTLERQTRQIGRLLDDLLEVGRISRGKLSLLRKHMDLSSLVQAVVEQKAQSKEAAAHDISLELSEAEAFVDGDELRLTQVLENLLTNAVKYTPAGGSIVVRVVASDEDVSVEVQDTGVGIDPEFSKRLFVPFEQAPQDLARSQGGLGLGLALAAQIIQAHGGDISAQSAGRNQGSRFVIRLPRIDVDRATLPSLDGLGLSPTRFLIIEDNADAAELLQMLLEAQGHKVELCDSGERALACICELKPQVVLCDIGLPQLSGYDVARQVRACAEVQDTALIALSGYGRSHDRDKAKEAGFDAHLKKPADYADICLEVRRVLGSKH